jgi:Na+/H+ antiporter
VSSLTVIFILLLATVVLAPVADKAKLPHPVLVTVFGLALSFVPGVPELHIEPDLILPLLLPPLIYAGAQQTSWRQFTSNAQPILFLAVALVFVTTAAVAAAAWAIVPGLSAMAAVALGAIVSPPDPVAAVAVAGPLGLPRRMVSVLEGEGLLNDVAALTLYQVAVASVVSGSFSVGRAAAMFVLSAVGAVLAGLVLGRLTLILSARLDTPELSSALTLLMPFAAYEIADRLHCSGVLAVLVIALYLGHYGADADNVQGRLQGTAFWNVVELLATGFGFGLIGMELRRAYDTVVQHNGLPGGQLLEEAAVICGIVILVRALWLLPAARLSHTRAGRNIDAPANWRETVVMIWAGMRGVVTIATALALPATLHNGEPYPARSATIVIAFSVVLVTLVVQGLSLPAVVSVLRVRAPEDRRDKAERDLMVRANKAALARLKTIASERELPDEVVDVLRTRQRVMMAAANPESIKDPGARVALAERAEQRQLQRELDAQMMAAARQSVLAARAEPGVDPEAADAVLRRLDVRSLPLL